MKKLTYLLAALVVALLVWPAVVFAGAGGGRGADVVCFEDPEQGVVNCFNNVDRFDRLNRPGDRPAAGVDRNAGRGNGIQLRPRDNPIRYFPYDKDIDYFNNRPGPFNTPRR